MVSKSSKKSSKKLSKKLSKKYKIIIGIGISIGLVSILAIAIGVGVSEGIKGKSSPQIPLNPKLPDWIPLNPAIQNPIPLTPSKSSQAIMAPTDSSNKGLPDANKPFTFFCFGGNLGNSLCYIRSSSNTTTATDDFPNFNTSPITLVKNYPGNQNTRDPFVAYLPNHTGWETSHDHLYFVVHTISASFAASPTSFALNYTPDFKTWKYTTEDAQSGAWISAMTNMKINDLNGKARNVWAPHIAWDAFDQKYIFDWASTIPGLFPDTDKTGDDNYNHRIWYTTSPTLKNDPKHPLDNDFSATDLLYNGGDSTDLTKDSTSTLGYKGTGGYDIIDAQLVYNWVNNNWIIFYKDERLTPRKKHPNSVVSVKGSADNAFSSSIFLSPPATVNESSIADTSEDLEANYAFERNPHSYYLLVDNFTNEESGYFVLKSDSFESTNWKVYSQNPFEKITGKWHNGSMTQLTDEANTNLPALI